MVIHIHDLASAPDEPVCNVLYVFLGFGDGRRFILLALGCYFRIGEGHSDGRSFLDLARIMWATSTSEDVEPVVESLSSSLSSLWSEDGFGGPSSEG